MERWLGRLERRHLADLRGPEVSRALRALSATYVERRDAIPRGAALNGRGKRAAFALFYGPLHFVVVRHIVRALDAGRGTVDVLVDLGCGTGAAGAAWALEFAEPPRVLGLDRHPWAVAEAGWTYRQVGLHGQARLGDATTARMPRGTPAILAAYFLDELSEEGRERLRPRLLDAAARGARVLIVEPIARGVTPWWPDWQKAWEAAGGRADEWRFPESLPEPANRFGQAAGLDYRELTARSLWLAGGPKPVTRGVSPSASRGKE